MIQQQFVIVFIYINIVHHIKKASSIKWHNINIYLENLWEETRADLLADKVIYSRQAGHCAAQRPVRGRPGPVRSVNPVDKRIRSLRVQVILVHNDSPGWHYLANSKFYHERLHISDAHATLQFRGHCNCLTIKKIASRLSIKLRRATRNPRCASGAWPIFRSCASLPPYWCLASFSVMYHIPVSDKKWESMLATVLFTLWSLSA